jgi:hypothetical protein
MADEKSRLWLMYPSRLITRPIVYELGHKFKVVTNVRQASVTPEVGIVSLELDGERAARQQRLRRRKSDFPIAPLRRWCTKTNSFPAR